MIDPKLTQALEGAPPDGEVRALVVVRADETRLRDAAASASTRREKQQRLQHLYAGLKAPLKEVLARAGAQVEDLAVGAELTVRATPDTWRKVLASGVLDADDVAVHADARVEPLRTR